MVKLKSCLGNGHCVLEMPTGTGKTVALLSLILAFQYKHTGILHMYACARRVTHLCLCTSTQMIEMIAIMRWVMDIFTLT